MFRYPRTGLIYLCTESEHRESSIERTSDVGRTITYASMIALSSVAALGQNMPRWQIDAGGKMAFEVASVKLSKPDTFRSPNFPLDSSDLFLDLRTKEPPH